MNEPTEVVPGGAPTEPVRPKKEDRGGLIGGTILIVLGLLFLAENFLPDFRFGDFWPVILIALGAGLLWKSKRAS